MSKKLTPMKQFAVDYLTENKGEKINPNQFADMWKKHTNGNGGYSSRRMFGYTSNAYQCLRGLAKDGIIQKETKQVGSYTSEEFFIH